MNIRELATNKPHLADAAALYERIEDFLKKADALKYMPAEADASYDKQTAEKIITLFSETLCIPMENISPLREAVVVGTVDFRRLPLNEVPAFASPWHEDELYAMLYIIGRPFLRWKAEASGYEKTTWDNGRCSVCGSNPSFAVMKKEDKKTLVCSFCGSTGTWRRIGCPSCMEIDGSKIDIIEAENEEGIRLELCNTCNSYIKAADEELVSASTADVADLMSLPLDIIAQQKGFSRNSPNPLGLRNIA
ncbi:MAG: formate dehydrogenase accessory protein FdhE [Nitrospiraceae bacterium]|nr:formate dehydrogenase accessory protein FdhE [Nitrospiraceae bacterium]